MRTAIAGVAVLGVALLAQPSVARADSGQPGFRFRTFDVPGATGTQVNGINDRNVFEGSYTDGSGQHGFVEDHGRLIRFDFPGTTGVTQAAAIDNSGDVVGYYSDAAGAFHGFLRTGAGAITALPSAPGAGKGSGQGTFPAGVTDAGEVVGYYVDADGVAHGYEQSPGGQFMVIDAPHAGTGAGQGTYLFSVNDAGVICGGYVTSGNREFGLVDRAGRITSLNDPATPQDTSGGTDAVGVAGGATVGDFVDQQGAEVGYLESGGHFETVADPLGSGAPVGTVLTATNSSLVLTGFYTTSSGVEHGLLAFPGQPW